MKKLIVFLVLGIYSCGKKPPNILIETSPNQDTETPVSINTIEKNLLEAGLVNIQEIDSSLHIDLKYSTLDNFFKQDVYGDLSVAYLQKTPAEALKKANSLLQAKNPSYRLLIFDAARPLHIQHILWQALDSIPPKKRKDFVADPAEGSIHNFGCAVDLSILDINTGLALDMGTPYDFFGPLAYPRLESSMLDQGLLNTQQIENRQLLRNIMQQASFEPITSEWWHFNFYSIEKAKRIYGIIP